MNKTLRTVLIVVIAALVGAALWAAFAGRSTTPDATQVTTSSSVPVASSTDNVTGVGTTKVQVALLDYTGDLPGKSRGCDHVIMREQTVPATGAPLTAALQTLFSFNSETVDGLGNFIARTKSTLSFDHATVQDGVAKVYLEGSLSGLAGVCDDPRAKIQIEETALQFPTVKSVELYLNGTKTDLQPSEKGE